MLFNSYAYILFFLPLTLCIYFFLANRFKHSAANQCLLIASLLFYGWWNIQYLLLLLGSAIVNYFTGTLLTKPYPKNKIILAGGIIFNLILLGYYKYTDFFISNINLLASSHLSLLNILLPLGISFFTFTQIAFLVDCYHGKAREYQFSNYLLFVTFFPHLLAGPIIHHAEMMPQFAHADKKMNYDNMLAALLLFSIGLFKKVGIADTLAIWANEGFNHTETLNLFSAWQTSLAYTFQLYFDFSGYSDMAIASALFFNIKFPMNFFSPYKCTSIQDFWRRWHITLSEFLKKYLYIPLGGNRKPQWQIYFNLMATFVIGGLWHGASWTFVFWGFLHGVATVIHRAWQKINIKMHPFLAWFIMFNFINVTWVFFRANTWHDAIKILQSMCDWQHLGHPNLMIFGCLLGILCFCLTTKNSMELLESNTIKKVYSPALIASILTLSFIVLSIKDAHEFLYFQF